MIENNYWLLFLLPFILQDNMFDLIIWLILTVIIISIAEIIIYFKNKKARKKRQKIAIF